MSKIAVVYWSGSGNTESMAAAVVEGITAKGAEAVLLSPDSFSDADVDDYDAFAFGCPSMGSEVLEESEFQPMWDGVISSLADKKVVLFGSYGWGDGEWMRNWEEEATGSNIQVVDTYICNETPDDDAVEACRELGAKLV